MSARADHLARALAATMVTATLTASAQTTATQTPERTLTPTLAAQLRLTEDAALGGDVPEPTLELRRLRVGLRASVLEGRLTAQVVLNTTPAALEVIDLWTEYALTPTLRLRAGQTKVPFTSYRMQSFTELAFVDWALVTRTFGGERELGVELHDRGRGGATEFSVGLWNGTAMRAAHGQGVAPTYGEPVDNLSDLRALRVSDAPHPEVSGRFVWRSPPAAPLRASLGVSATFDARPVEAHDLRASVAPEASVAMGPLRLDVTGYLGVSDLVETRGLGALGGVLAELQARLGERVVLALRFARVDVDDALRADAVARAARRIEQSSSADRNTVQQRYASAGRARYDQELTAGAAVRLVGTWLIAQLDVGWLRSGRDDGDRDEARGRAQLQLAF